MRIPRGLLVLFTIGWMLSSAHALASTKDSGSPPALDDMVMTLTPEHAAGNVPDAIRVRYTFTRHRSDAWPLSLSFDTLQPMLERKRDEVTQLHVADESGDIPLGPPEFSRTSDATLQVWKSTRSVKGPVTVEYVVPAALPITTKRGPHIDLQAAGGGLSGAFVGFLLMPQVDGKTLKVHVHWKLGDGELAVTTRGDGDLTDTLSKDELGAMLFMAGPVETYRPGDSRSGFRAYALGLKADQLTSIAGWSAAAYDAERSAFRVPNAPYRFFIRSYAGGPITSGRSTDGGFMLYLPPGTDTSGSDLHDLVAHELVHSLIKDMDDEPGEVGDWYTEGTAEYFKLTIPFAAGLYTPSEYVAYINKVAAEYYTNSQRDVNNQKLSEIMWAGRNVWTLPYGRGGMYFAALEGQLRAHRSTVTVLDLVNETSERIRHGAPAVGKTWTGVLSEKLGPWAIADWQAMMDGKLVMPSADAFGPCATGQSIRTGFFDLGFPRPVRLNEGGVIDGVVAGSAAARAGLQDGDRLMESVDLNPLYGAYDAPVTLHVKRGKANESMTISYDPHSGSMPAMAWKPSQSKACHVQGKSPPK